MLSVKRITTRPPSAPGTLSGCCSLPGCDVGRVIKGEVLDVEDNAVTVALQGLGCLPPGAKADVWLFKKVAEAAIKAHADGGVWKAYGKFNLSAPSRNQNIAELRNYFSRIGCTDFAEAISRLVSYTEKRYTHKVTAVQINMHFTSASHHKQHRDIYSLDQADRAGRNCTCSFKTSVATACFTVGSSRRLLVQTEMDKYSPRKKCSAECEGEWKKPWLHSGSLVYFNDKWNKSHTHGIPRHDVEHDGECGARVSFALLCSDGDPVCAMEPSLSIQMPTAVLDADY